LVDDFDFEIDFLNRLAAGLLQSAGGQRDQFLPC
jgi:hypothetical protein